LSSIENIHPLVSIIIPVYNREGLVEETLDSILAQSFKNWECIIVDDGSSDNTLPILEEYSKNDPRIKYFDRPEDRPKGANACRNYGFEKSSGEFIQWFDSDDLMDENYLQTMLNGYTEDTDVAICSFYRFGQGSEEVIYNTGLEGDPWRLFYEGRLTFNTQPYLYRRNKIVNIRYDETLTRAQDLDYVFRAFRDSVRAVRYVPEVLIKLRQHPDTITTQFKEKKTLIQFKDEIRVRRMIMDHAARHEELRVFYPLALKKLMMVLRNAVSSGFLSIFTRELFSLNIKISEKLSFFFYGMLIFLFGKGRAKFYTYLIEIVKKRS
jgi:glycosyltransferase involved in cell wall biosynthesis